MENKQSPAIPVAIIIAGLLVGGGIFLSGRSKQANETPLPQAVQSYRDITVKPVTALDHIRGSASAQIVLVEYSDTECPFCKNFHSILKDISAQYDASTEFAWAYRHFPIAQLHPKALKQAEASECAAEQGKFWEYLDEIYAVTPSNNGLAESELPRIAVRIGLNQTAFENCLSSGRHTATVTQQIADAQAADADGTPTSFLMLKSPLSEKKAQDVLLATAPFKMADGTPLVSVNRERSIVSMSGAMPYDFAKAIIDIILDK